jgi:hypothetical protein
MVLFRFSSSVPDEPAPDFACPELDENPREVRVDYTTSEVARHDATGKPLWAVKLNGDLGRLSPPQLVWDNDRVYLAHDDGVTALDFGSGKVLWHSAGPSDGLLLSRDLLLATGSFPADGGPGRESYLLARSVRDGAEAFKVKLPASESYLLPVEEFADLFAVQYRKAPGEKGIAWLADRKGEVRHRFTRQVVGGARCGKDRVFLTSTDVVCVSPDDKVRWTIPFQGRQWIAGGGLVELPGGDLVAFRYGRFSDSGVRLIRFTGSGGKVVWETYCSGLGVGHSEYYHCASVAVAGETIRVSSRGARGWFVEVLDLTSGRQLRRTVKKE